MERRFNFLPDSELVHFEWKRLVEEHQVCGKQVHDARIVASMNVHGVSRLLTLNPSDFKRYQQILAIHPQTIAEVR